MTKPFLVIVGMAGTAIAVSAYLRHRSRKEHEARLWNLAKIEAVILAGLIGAFKLNI